MTVAAAALFGLSTAFLNHVPSGAGLVQMPRNMLRMSADEPWNAEAVAENVVDKATLE